MQTVAAYIIPAILTLLGIAQYDFSHHKKGKNFLWLTLYLYLIVVMGFRFEVGGDTLTYMSWFEWARDLQHWTPTDIYEPGFTIIGAIVKSCNGEFYHLQLIHAVILNTCIFIFISQNTRYRFSALLMAFLTYYIYFSTEVMRESIAVFIFTFNYKSFLERRWKTYYIGVVVCMFFHLSSSFLLLLPLLRNLKFNNRFLMVIVVACCIFYVMNPIISLLDSFVPIIADKAKSYGRHTYVGYFWVGMRVIQFSVIPYFVLYLNKKHFKTELKFESVYLYMIIIGMGMIFIPIIFQRFTNYFYPMLSLSMADLICKGFSSLNINKKCMSAVLSLVVCVGYGTYFIYLDFYEMWVPYSWVFNPIQYSERYKFANGGEK